MLRCIVIFKKSSDPCQYAPIAAALNKIDTARMAATKRKCDIAYTIAKENMAFRKMGDLCELQERHGVDLGSGYKNEKACATFVDLILLDQRRMLVNLLDRARFFSLQLDGSADSRKF